MKIVTERPLKILNRETEKLFKAYLKEKAPALILDDQLTRIFAEMRQSNGEKYKQTTLTVIRHGIKLFNITVTNLF